MGGRNHPFGHLPTPFGRIGGGMGSRTNVADEFFRLKHNCRCNAAPFKKKRKKESAMWLTIVCYKTQLLNYLILFFHIVVY